MREERGRKKMREEGGGREEVRDNTKGLGQVTKVVKK